MSLSFQNEVVAALKAVLRWFLIAESGDWFSMEVVPNWPLFSISATSAAQTGIPAGGLSLADIKTEAKFLGVPVSITGQGTGQPPWIGAEGGSGAPSYDMKAQRGPVGRLLTM